MATQKQIEANRRNAARSTGPTSVEGKAAASQNAFKSGIHAKAFIVKGEKVEDFQALIDEYYLRHRPDTPELRGLVDDLIFAEWEIRRLTRAESLMWNYQMEDSWTREQDKFPMGKAASLHYKAFGFLQRRLDSTRRARDRALHLLREHRVTPIPAAEPVPEPAPAPSLTPCSPTACSEIGFVPSSSSQPLPTPLGTPLPTPAGAPEDLESAVLTS